MRLSPAVDRTSPATGFPIGRVPPPVIFSAPSAPATASESSVSSRGVSTSRSSIEPRASSGASGAQTRTARSRGLRGSRPAALGCGKRKHLRRVQEPMRVEDVLHAKLGLEIVGRELRRHKIALLDADAVLAGQAAARLDAELQDLGAERLAALQVAGLVRIEKDEGVHVAVASVEDVRDIE